ncbi:MAG: hypothetical protein K5669_04745 [Lachnospiraceae bacterium]|nr:hypothetical protein [Lachnospiraceae bacterium]
MEASVVLPLFLFFFINLLSSIEMIRVHNNITLALMDIGNKISFYGAFLDNSKKDEAFGEKLMSEIGDLAVSYLYVRNSIVNHIGGEYLEQSPVVGAASGLSMIESDILTDDDCVDIGVTYRVSPPIEFGNLFSFRMSNRYYAHLWNGYDIGGEEKDEEKGQIVYITEDSEVYHMSRECTHLKLSIRPAPYSLLGDERNSEGKRYTRCLFCAWGEHPDTVYLCDEGEKYHYSRNCLALKRSYKEVLLKEVINTHRPCSRCGEINGAEIINIKNFNRDSGTYFVSA